jgi:hypothetical protein
VRHQRIISGRRIAPQQRTFIIKHSAALPTVCAAGIASWQGLQQLFLFYCPPFYLPAIANDWES